MRSLDPIGRDHEGLYRSCVSQTKNIHRRDILLDMTERVVNAGKDYVRALSLARPDVVARMAMSEDERVDISDVYGARLLSKSGVERATYDQIKTLTGKCPFCGFGEVWEVDHYLPNSVFPELNVLPKNLVPICHGCNHRKLANLPENASRSLLHPYFDRLPNTIWLFANLTIRQGGPVLEYHVFLDAAHGTLGERIGYHFLNLELGRRMKLQSAQILVDLEGDIDEFLGDLGPERMREHFQSEGEREYARHGNTMEMAAYFAAAANHAYCSGAYRN